MIGPLFGRLIRLDGEFDGAEAVVAATDFSADLGVLSGRAGGQVVDTGVHGGNLR